MALFTVVKIGDPKEYRTTADWPYHISAGGVVYRVIKNKPEVVLLYRGQKFYSQYGRDEESWHLPHGTMAYDETIIDCALRETREEAGIEAEVEAYLGVQFGDWMVDKHYVKYTHYFLMRHLNDLPEGMDYEHESMDWVSPEEAREKLAYEKEIIDRAKEALGKIHPTLFPSPAESGRGLG